ncbi:AraC-type DNA-binding protein [Aquimarina amphilecti]|uniref:AraC-type DNA-binding protein n=1 Tax=Aquimarina amphilecti TaxID=1038014 RepID=A0A1H7UY11_AQUAM|nr:AraC family transcriptional regulator [Aquimarina amphilecti]SEM01407.1 AraC-type DNA-binding protein [Aquimarina amphilecti]
MDTEIVQHIELLVGSIGVILGMFFAIFLIVNSKNIPVANVFLVIYLVAFCLRIGKSLFHNYFEINATLRTAFLTVLLCIGPSIWLYVLYLIGPETKQKSRNLFHFLLFFVLLSICWLIPNNGSRLFGVFYDFLIVHMAGYIVFSLLWLRNKQIKGRAEGKAKIIAWLFYFLFINLIFVVMYFLISELIIPFYIGISFLFSLVIICLSFWALNSPFLFTNPIEKYKQSTFNHDEAYMLMEKLKVFMEEEKPFLNPEMTLPKLSRQFKMSTNELSQIINQTESLNYSQFISKYRVREAQNLMSMSTYVDMTIGAIAYDSGFNSISSFNSSFKKHTKMTPIEYRKSIVR